MQRIACLLFLAHVWALAQSRPVSPKPSAPQNQSEPQQKWHAYEARLQAIGRPGQAALRRERVRRKQRLCVAPADIANRDAEVKCRAAENQITQANYLTFKQTIGRLLRLNADAYPEIPESQQLPFDDAEEAWVRGREAICDARVKPGHTPEPPNPNAENGRLGCVMFLTQEHMEELSDLYFLVLEGTS